MNWQPYREPLRTTIMRTFAIALVMGAIAAIHAGGVRRWPSLALLFLWPAFGGHWIDLFFLNWLRPRLPSQQGVQRIARIAVWFGGGVVLAAGMRMTVQALFDDPHAWWLAWLTTLTWFRAGMLFVAIELVAHAVLYRRARPSFFNGLG